MGAGNKWPGGALPRADRAGLELEGYPEIQPDNLSIRHRMQVAWLTGKHRVSHPRAHSCRTHLWGEPGMKLEIILPDSQGPEHLDLERREAWALLQLIIAGEKGCTPIDNPAPRWSAYVFKLRRRGISLETVNERHGGAFAGNHARYVLRSRVRVLEGAQ